MYFLNKKMNNQNNDGQNNNNNRVFNNQFNLDPDHEDIYIEKKLDRDIFCPILALCSCYSLEFGAENDYYSLANANPLKESFFYLLQATVFPNVTLTQISLILCYIIIVVYIVLLCFGLDETNLDIFLQVKLSTLDKIGSFYPKRIKKNYWEFYRLLTFHFLHYNFLHLIVNLVNLISLCSFFESVIKKHLFLIIIFLTGILTNIAYINIFKDDERLCGLNCGINGLFGAFITLFILNWNETLLLFGGISGRILVLDIIIIVSVANCFFFELSQVNGHYLIQFISAIFGGLIFATIAKPIRSKPWKLIARIFSGCILLGITVGCLVSFISKNINS